MLQEERYQRLRALLANFQQITTERIAIDLGVSRETVRRDVLGLEALGELRRVHGGVIATGPNPELPINERANVRLKEKRAIARAAAKLPSPGQTLFLDGGSTTVSALAEELASLSGLTIITNSFDVALKLTVADGAALPRNEVIMLGGRPSSGVAATYGETTVAEIYRHAADWAFLSPVGLHVEQGATSYEHREVAVARAMVRQSTRTAILADHSKLGQISRVSFCPISEIDMLVVNSRARKEPAFAELEATGLDVILA
jgi:DeoR/GlpR family transcriptional regulator of sugar metabolism